MTLITADRVGSVETFGRSPKTVTLDTAQVCFFFVADVEKKRIFETQPSVKTTEPTEVDEGKRLKGPHSDFPIKVAAFSRRN